MHASRAVAVVGSWEDTCLGHCKSENAPMPKWWIDQSPPAHPKGSALARIRVLVLVDRRGCSAVRPDFALFSLCLVGLCSLNNNSAARYLR
jgi:hypothetical protein